MEWPMLAKGGCVGSGLEDALTWQEEEGWGVRAPFLGLSPPGHLACQRERLPLGPRDCPPPPILCTGFIFNTVFG